MKKNLAARLTFGKIGRQFNSDLSSMDNMPGGVAGSAMKSAGGGMQMSSAPAATPPANTTNQSNTNSGALAIAIQSLANSNNGTYNFGTKTLTLSTPRSTTWSATSTMNASAISKTVLAFNQDYGLPVTPTTNGSGANSIVYGYNDLPGNSATGNLISQIFGQMNRGKGQWCYGFTIIYQTVSTATSQNNNAVLQSNPVVNYYNGDGTIKPLYINVNEAIRNTQYQGGTLTIVQGFNLSRMCQFSILLPAGDGATNTSTTTATVTFMYRPLAGN